MRLLIFTHSLAAGGAERVVANLANYWSDRGWNVTVLTMAGRTMDFYVLDPAVNRIALDFAAGSSGWLVGLKRNVERIVRLRRTLRKIQPDIALAMMTSANVLLALGALGLPGIRTIGSERIHPPQLPLGLAWEWLRRASYGLLHAVVALTRESADWLATCTTARKVVTIPNVASWPVSSCEPVIAPEEYSRIGRHLALSVGRLTEQKDFARLIAAFADCAADFQGWDLAILGEGELREDLVAQVSALGLADRIFLPGRAGNVGDWYGKADLYVMTSSFEGFPNALAEALAHGVPSISFDCDTGPRDIIRHEIDGLLVDVGDMAALREALVRLMADPGLRERFGHRAIEVRSRFSSETIMTKWQDLFLELVDERQ